MELTLFKPVYVTPAMSITRKLGAQHNNVIDNVDIPSPPMTSLSFTPVEHLNNADCCVCQDSIIPSAHPSAALPAFMPKFISTKVIKLQPSRTVSVEEDNETENVYIARPYKQLMAHQCCESSSTIPWMRSTAMDDSFETEPLQTQTTIQTSFPENQLIESSCGCFSGSKVLELLNDTYKVDLVHKSCDGEQHKYRVFKSASDYYLNVPHSNEKNSNKVNSLLKMERPQFFSDCPFSLLPLGTQSTSFLQSSLHESYSSGDGDPIALISPTQSSACTLHTKSNQNPRFQFSSSRPVSECNLTSQTMSEYTVVSIAKGRSMLDRVSGTGRTESIIAHKARKKDRVAPRDCMHEVLYLKASSSHSWLPCSCSDFNAKRLICSMLYTAGSIVGRFPVSFIKHQQIYDVHAEFAVAKSLLHVDDALNPTLISKSFIFLEADLWRQRGVDEHNPILPISFLVESNVTVGEIEVFNHHRHRPTHETRLLYRLSKDNVKFTKKHLSNICSAQAWPSISSALTSSMSPIFTHSLNVKVDESSIHCLESSPSHRKHEFRNSNKGEENTSPLIQKLLPKTATSSPLKEISCDTIESGANTSHINLNTFGSSQNYYGRSCSKRESCFDQEMVTQNKEIIPSKATVGKNITFNPDLTHSYLVARSNQLNYNSPTSNIASTLPKAEREFQISSCSKEKISKEYLNTLPGCNLEEQVTKIDTPVIDIKIVPKIPNQDEPIKLNVIKGTTSYRQLVNFIATRTTNVQNQRPKSVLSEKLMASMEKSMLPQMGIYSNFNDYESTDSSILIPEGHPAGWNADDEKNDIYLSWTSVQKTRRDKPFKQLFEMDSPSDSEKLNYSFQYMRKLSDQKPERDHPTAYSKVETSTLQSNRDLDFQNPKGSFNRTALEEGTLGLKNRLVLASRVSHKNAVTWASEITHASDSNKGGAKKEDKRLQHAKDEGEVDGEGEADEEAEVRTLRSGNCPIVPDHPNVTKNEAEKEPFIWKCQNDIRENAVFEADISALTEQDLLKNRKTDKPSKKQGPSSLISATGRRSCLVSSTPGEVTTQTEFLMRSDYRSPEMNDVTTLREDEFRSLMKKYRDLRRELKKRSPYKSDVDENGVFEMNSSSTTTSTTESACVSTSHRQSYGHFRIRSLPKNCRRVKGHSLRNGKKSSKIESLTQQRRQRHGRRKDDHGSSTSRDNSNPCRSYKYRHWLPISQYAGYPPPPQPYPSYAYPSFPYYPPPPPPPALPHPNYMAPPPMLIDPWTCRHCCTSRRYRRHKSRNSSMRHQRPTTRKHKLKKELRKCKEVEISANQSRERNVLHNEDSTLSIRTSKAFLGPPVTACYQTTSNAPLSHPPQIATPTVSDTSMQPPQSSLPRPLSPLHQSNNVPRGIYTLPEAGGPSFNPFKGHSLPNEPSGLVETRLATVSPPTKTDPSPSAAFSGAVYGASKIHSIHDNQSRSTASAQMPLSSASIPKNPGVQSQTVQGPSQPPNRRAVYQNAPPRQPLSDVMAPSPGEPNPSCAAPRPLPPKPGAKVDGPQVTSTGDKYGLFRMPTSEAEYISCEKRFDWLQSEKTHLENSLNKLTMESASGASGRKHPLGSKTSMEESRVSNALCQIGREMSALRLVMKKYTNERKKGLLLKTATF